LAPTVSDAGRRPTKFVASAACPYRFGRALRCPTSVWLAVEVLWFEICAVLGCWMTCARARAPRLAWSGSVCGRCAGLHRAESALKHIYIYVQLQVVVQVSSADASVCCRHNCCCRYIYLLLQVQVASCCCRYNLAGPAAAADSTATGSAAANVVASSAAAGAQVLLQVLLLHACKKSLKYSPAL
jgi:hypothetical protein